MTFYKNKNTNDVANFGGVPNLEEWECIEKNGEVMDEFQEVHNLKKIEKLKSDKDRELKDSVERIIFSKYPIYTQLNLSNEIFNYSEEEIQEMKSFIDEELSKYRDKKQLLETLNDEDEIVNISL
jgi:hypothetical protein